MKRLLIAIAVTALAAFASHAAVTVLTGDQAIAKIQEMMPGTNVTKFGITKDTVKWASNVMTGVDLGFMHVSNLYGAPDDINIVRIDYKKAKLKMKLVYNEKSNVKTSVATKNAGALIGVSGTFYNSTSRVLSYKCKFSGKTPKSDSSGGGGLVFNDNDPYRLFHFTKNFGTARILEHWDNALPSDCVMINGSCSLDKPWKSGNPSAGFPVLGVNENTGVIILLVIDGRRSTSKGITYYDSYQLLAACGCTGGYCLDGGGSTTLVLKDSLVPASKFSQVQYTAPNASGYTIMNYTNSDGSTKAERAVLTQLLFVPDDNAAAPIPTDTFFDLVRTDGQGGSDGQRVQLDYVPNSASVVSSVFSMPATPVADVNQCFWCARHPDVSTTEDIRDEFSLFASVGSYARFDYGTKRNDTKYRFGANTLYRFSVTGNVMSNVNYDAGTVAKTYTAPSQEQFTGGGKMSLFMSYQGANSGWNNAAAMDFGSMRIADRIEGKDYGAVDLVGYYRNGKYGLYDAMKDKFYPSAGTRDFVQQEWSMIKPGTTLSVEGTPYCVPAGKSALGVDYGVTHWHAKGETIAVKRPSGEITLSANVKATLKGWELTQGGTVKTNAAAFTYTHGTGNARLVALWDLKFNLKVASLDTTLGTVNTSGGWKAYGASVTLKATPMTGQRFYGWKGDIGDADPASETIAVKMDRPRVVWADFGPRWTEWTTFPKGAFVDTLVVPEKHETSIRFSCDYLSGGWIFGTASSDKYYGFNMYNTYWRWGITNLNHTSETVFGSKTPKGKWTEGEHEVVYREHGTGNLIVDGEVYEDISQAWSSKTLWLGKGYNTANFAGKVMGFKVRDGAGKAVANLKPCVWFDESGTETAGFYDVAQERFLTSEGAGFPFAVGVLSRRRVLVDGLPFKAGVDEGIVDYAPIDDVEADESVTMSVPAQFTFGEGNRTRATCLGWRRYRREIPTETEKLLDSGTGNTVTFKHEGLPCRFEWQWKIEYYLDAATLDASKGGVTSASGWKEAGSTVTLTATKSAGETFFGWIGETGDARADQAQITLTMDRARTVRADFGPQFVEYAEFPYGAYVATAVVPTNCETRIVFSSDYLNNGWIFGTTLGANYYGLSMNSSYWRWGLNNVNHTGKTIGANVALCDNIDRKHEVIYREHGTGNLLFDGEVLEAVTNSTATKPLVLGYAPGTAVASGTTRGRVFSFTVRYEDGRKAIDLRPCERTLLDGTKSVQFYDLVSKAYFENKAADKDVVAGPYLRDSLVVTGEPYDIADAGAAESLSVPARIPFGDCGEAECTGWKRYRYDVYADSWELKATGSGNSIGDYVHDGFPTKIVWQWKLPQSVSDGCLYVQPGGSDANKGTSWNDAYATVQAAVDAAAEGATVLVAPGRYRGGERSFNAKVDYLTCIRLAKRVNVIGIGGRERTLMDGGFVYPRNGAYVTADGAFLSGFTFTNTAHTTTGRNLGVDLTAGTVSNVSFHARAAANSNFLNINATVGHVLATDILLPPQPVLAGNVQGGTYVNAIGAKGATIDGLTMCNWLLGGLSANYSMINLKGSAATAPIILRNALVADNQMGIDLNANRGNIVCADTHSRVINCTIVNNEVRGPNSGLRVAATSALVENCIVRGNRSAMNAYGDIYNNSNVGYVYYTLCDQLDVVTKDNPNHNLHGNPNFADEANGDYRLTGVSKCVDAGGEKNGDTSLFGTSDLAGAARVVGAAADLGCYEHQATDELEIGFEASAEESEPGHQLAVTFTGRATGAGDVAAVWDFGDGTTATGWPVVDHSYAVPGLYAVTLTVTRGGRTVSYTLKDVARVLPSVCYVKADGGKGVWPYDTMDKATDDIAAALEVGSPRVLVGPGTYTLPLPCIAIGRAVELKSLEGPEKTILDSPKTITDCVHRHFTVYNDKAVVSGFTLTGGYSSSAILANYAAVLDLGAGTVENCIIRDTGRLSAGQVVNLCGSGKLVGCELDGRGLDVHDNTYNGTAAIYLTGASCVVDGCWIHGYQIRGNCDNKTTFTYQAPIVVSHASAVLRNSLITCCTNALAETTANTNHSGIVQIFKGKVENCTIADNFVGGLGAVNFALANNKEATVTAGSLVNCILSGNVSLGGEPGVWCPKAGATWSDCYVGDAPGYATGADAVPYSLAAGSPCIDAGQDLAWVATGWDLVGNPRLAGAHVDLGCLESGSSVTRYTIEEVSADGKSTNTVTVLEDELVKTVEGAEYGEKVQLKAKLETDVDITLAPGVEIAFAAGQDMSKIHLKAPSGYYCAPVVSGGIVQPLQLDPEQVTPAFEGTDDQPAFEMTDGRLSFNIGNVKPGLKYTLSSAPSPSGPWTPLVFKFGGAGDDISFEAETTDPSAFYRVSVTDAP